MAKVYHGTTSQLVRQIVPPRQLGSRRRCRSNTRGQGTLQWLGHKVAEEEEDCLVPSGRLFAWHMMARALFFGGLRLAETDNIFALYPYLVLEYSPEVKVLVGPPSSIRGGNRIKSSRWGMVTINTALAVTSLTSPQLLFDLIFHPPTASTVRGVKTQFHSNVKQRCPSQGDGGGAGVLSELLILEQIMYRVQATLGSDTTPAPCDYFEVIGGSGTGGIIALMLGRLRMSIFASILAYEKLRPKPKSGSTEEFKASQLEAVLRQIFQEEKMRDVSPHACKTFVCAMHESNMNAGIPQLFRSYNTPEEPAFNCKIWEAARATSATPRLFKPMEIGRGGVRPKYIGGGVWNNNPTSLVVAEAEKMYPSQPVVLVVSIGSGHPDTIQIPRSPTLTAFAKTLKSIATDCERIHEDNARRFRSSPNTYFRLNVLQGLQGFEQQHWGRSGEVSAHTHVYLGMEDTKSKLTSAVNVILNPVVPMSDSPTYLKVCPPPSVRFTGREDIVQQMTEYFNTSIGQRHIFLLHGLGGSGKSQIAFKFVEKSTRMSQSRFPEVYFVDSSSQQTIENDLVTLALVKKVGKTFQDSLLWLSNQHTEWLIIFNNADDINLNLGQYFPSGSHGNILVTSRNPDLGQLAQATHKVEQMALEEAIDLLLSAARYDIMEVPNRDVAKRIVQAGAYISSSRGLQKYLNLYEQTATRIQLLHQKPPQSEYGWSVYATWQISFGNISSQARDLLELCSFIHHDGITEGLFQQAALYKLRQRGPTPAELHKPLDFLAKFCSGLGSKWDSLKFIAVTNELARFSLIDFQAASGDITFSIHPLVHEWCRAIMKVDASTELCMHKLIGMSLASRGDDFRFSHQMFPHLDALVFNAGLDLSRWPNVLDNSFAPECLWVYHKEGKWSDGVHLGESMLHTLVLQLDEQQTLTIQGHLAIMYAYSGVFHQAVELDKVVLSKRRELLGEDHPDTLKSMANLAVRYSQMGQLHEAAELERVVLSKRSELFGEDHPDTLRTMGNLGFRYSQMGQSHEAAELEKVTLSKQMELLGENHPHTLFTMGNLAVTYSDMGQLQDAADLAKVVLSKRRELLGEDHPNTLHSLANSGIICFKMGRLTEARELQERALNACRRVLGEDHPDTTKIAQQLDATIEQLDGAGRKVGGLISLGGIECTSCMSLAENRSKWPLPQRCQIRCSRVKGQPVVLPLGSIHEVGELLFEVGGSAAVARVEITRSADVHGQGGYRQSRCGGD
ncbi:hypothetical protein FB451DRAFT_1447901 [Mycena latifolia]|nr:hypothetical protein FB451DRAFT_1447901 [Mycena latifolia]